MPVSAWDTPPPSPTATPRDANNDVAQTVPRAGDAQAACSPSQNQQAESSQHSKKCTTAATHRRRWHPTNTQSTRCTTTNTQPPPTDATMPATAAPPANDDQANAGGLLTERRCHPGKDRDGGKLQLHPRGEGHGSQCGQNKTMKYVHKQRNKRWNYQRTNKCWEGISTEMRGQPAAAATATKTTPCHRNTMNRTTCAQATLPHLHQHTRPHRVNSRSHHNKHLPQFRRSGNKLQVKQAHTPTHPPQGETTNRPAPSYGRLQPPGCPATLGGSAGSSMGRQPTRPSRLL